MWTVNATWGLTSGFGSGQTWVPWTPAVGVVMGVVAVVTVLLNSMLLISILLHETARSRSFHLHIVNMAVVAILQGAGVLPLWTHYLAQGQWIHGDSACRWWLATDTMATSVSALAIVVTACDRFIYLACWRFVKEGGKYITCCALMALAWLLALGLTLTLTLLEMEGDDGVMIGVSDGACLWGQGRDRRVVYSRLVMFVMGAGLGLGLCLALVTLPCLGIGHMLPVDDTVDEVKERVRRRSVQYDIIHRQVSRQQEPGEGVGLEAGEDDVFFPRFALIKKTDRLEERERWKWQVVSLLTVALAWVILWLPSHLIVFAEVIDLGWQIAPPGQVASVVIGYVHAAVMPLLWLLHKPVRLAVLDLIFCRCCRGDKELDDSMEFDDMPPHRLAEIPT
ncbi:probable G-protein coupled receptor No18 [Littorina saxatilis]|uniref:G-protein coupled receptors family 1 profile domain-containing protein n=1 Tax=Littorina saxatilis TaxID=31220 RepID=A0AAN9BBK8_9CAEN